MFKSVFHPITANQHDGNDINFNECSGYIILPEDVVNKLTQLKIRTPYIFEISRYNEIITERMNNLYENTVCVGVWSFVSMPGTCILPNWMFEYLKIDPDDPDSNVVIKNVELQKGKRVVLRPSNPELLKGDYRGILEKGLKWYICLNQGTVIPVMADNNVYEVSVVKTEPQPRILSNQVDLECDFAETEDKFTHRFNDPDTDSSDNEGGNVTAHFLDKPSKVVAADPLRSTFAKREEQRKLLPPQFIRIKNGEEILPPKPKGKDDKKKKV